MNASKEKQTRVRRDGGNDFAAVVKERIQKDELYHHALAKGLQVIGPDPGGESEEVVKSLEDPESDDNTQLKMPLASEIFRAVADDSEDPQMRRLKRLPESGIKRLDDFDQSRRVARYDMESQKQHRIIADELQKERIALKQLENLIEIHIYQTKRQRSSGNELD